MTDNIFEYINPQENNMLNNLSGSELQELLYYLENYYLEYRDSIGVDKDITFGMEIELSHSNNRQIKNKLKNIIPNWKAVNDTAGCRYGQIVNVNNAVITPNSKVDLQLSSEQMAIFYEKDLAFVAENEDGVVTIYCIGQVPQNDYTIQATVTEVVING